MSSKLEKAVKLLIILSFFVPLVLVSSSFIFPFIVPKILVFRSLTLLMLGCYILLLRLNWQKYKVKINWINGAVGLFLFSFTVSTFVGVDWYRSFWDNHERMLGLFTVLHFIIYYFVLTSVVKEWKEWRWLLRIFLFAGCLVMLIGLMQKINPEFLLNRGSGRVSATLGNAIYFSGYGLFLMFIGLLLALKEPVRLRSYWFWYAVIGALFGFFGIFLGGTRGTFLGLLAGLFVLFFILFVTLRGHSKVKLTILIIVVVGMASLTLLVIFRQTNLVGNLPILGSLLNTKLSSGTAATRLIAWSIAVESWKEKPIFGWGPNNYYYAFNKFYRPESLEHGWGETWFDNAHSAAINTLNTQGIFGFLAYLGLFAVPSCVLWSGYRKGRVDVRLLAFGSAFLVGHFVHNVFVFENPTSYLYFFFFLAFINSQSECADNPDLQISKKMNKNVSLGFGAIVFLVTVVLIYTTNINPARANMASLNAIKSLQTGKAVIEAYKKAADIPSPHIDDIRSDFVRSLILIIPQYINVGLADKAKELYRLGYEESKKNFVLHPLDVRTHMQFAQLVQQAVVELKEPAQLMLEAEAVLKQALSISPKRQQVLYQLAMLELQIGNPKYAAALLQETIDDDPKIAEGWWRLALAYAHSGNNQKALETIKTAQDMGMQFDAQGQNVVSMIMEASKKSK